MGEIKGAKLVDCFMEIFSYTLYLLKDIKGGDLPDFEKVKEDYNHLFERSARMASQYGFSRVRWKKGCFPVCAFVDEKILCSSWSEKGRWLNYQLQRKFFNTTNAGEEFFQKMQKLGDDEKDVREVYSYCLAFGFTGRYYAPEDEERLQEIRTENFLKYFEEDEEVGLPETIFPRAYSKGVSPKRTMFSFRSNVATLLFVLIPIGVGLLYWILKMRLDELFK